MAPLVVLLELSIVFARVVERRATARRRAEEDGPDDDEIGDLGVDDHVSLS